VEEGNEKVNWCYSSGVLKLYNDLQRNDNQHENRILQAHFIARLGFSDNH